MKTSLKTSYFSFGQNHSHLHEGKTIDSSTLVEITDDNPRELMIRRFGLRWSMEYDHALPDPLFTSGIVKVTRESVGKYLMDSVTIAHEQVVRLYQEMPDFQGHEDDLKNYRASMEVLLWMVENVPFGAKTLEIGCGYSTVIFSILSREHTVVSPFSEEHSRVFQWIKRECPRSAQTGQSDGVTYVCSTSQEIKKNERVFSKDIDCLLIDGDHSFPIPIMDWYNFSDGLKVGGHLIVDDTHIASGTILAQFLDEDVGRWLKVFSTETSATYQKIAHPAVTCAWWGEQPFSKNKIELTKGAPVLQ